VIQEKDGRATSKLRNSHFEQYALEKILRRANHCLFRSDLAFKHSFWERLSNIDPWKKFERRVNLEAKSDYPALTICTYMTIE